MKIIYIAGFRQHAGKTMTSLGLISLLKKYIPEEKIGYIKPVGQELFVLPDGSKIDKDGKIIEQFVLPSVDMKVISPVRLGSGVTKAFLKSPDRAKVTAEYKRNILDAFKSMEEKGKDIVIAEGTGHPGVGSIVGLSNADVSNLIGADVLFLAGGGVGKTLDMLETDLSYFRMKGTHVKGIIFNKLYEDKIPSMKELVNEPLINSYFSTPDQPIGIMGYLPEMLGLNRPSMRLLQRKFPDSMVVGDINSNWETPIGGVKIISLNNEHFNPELYIKSGDVVILSADSQRRLNKLLEFHKKQPEGKGLSGLIFTCNTDNCYLKENIKLMGLTNLPAFYVRMDTSSTDERLHNIISNTKIQPWDVGKMNTIRTLFEQHFNMEKFSKTFGLNL